jgi:hypothetical protein
LTRRFQQQLRAVHIHLEGLYGQLHREGHRHLRRQMEHPRAAVYRLAHGCGVSDAALYELDVVEYPA